MGITPVDHNPFATQYGPANGPITSRTRGMQPPAPREYPRLPAVTRAPLPPAGVDAPGLQQPWGRDQINQMVDDAQGKRTAIGMIQRGQKADAQMIIDDMKRRYANNPGAMSMINFLAAQHNYGDAMSNTLKRMIPRQPGAQPRPVEQIDPRTQVVGPTQPQQEPVMQQPPRYGNTPPRQGMVVNGYRLVDPSRPNDRSSWQPIRQ